jgi:hypothetical protein
MPAFTLPSENQGSWLPGTNVGIPGGIEQYLAAGPGREQGVNDRALTGTVRNVVTAHGADDTGATDVSAAVDAAITAASNGDVIYFPAGRFRLSTSIYIPIGKQNITIRGAGTGLTTFFLSANVTALFVWADPGYIASDIQAVTGTKTKGTSTLTVGSNSGFTTAGQFAWIGYENETNNARIQAGAAPTWSSLGFPWARTMTARVTGTTPTSISIDPPLPADATNLNLRIHTYGYPTYIFTGWGFEDFSVEFDSALHPSRMFNVTTAQYSWFYNIHFKDWSRNSSNGSCIKISKSYRVQVQNCRFDAETGSSSDGAIETGANSSIAIIDNIFTGPWGFHTYDSGNSVNCFIGYNFSTGTITGFHNTHPSLNLIEGNVATNHHSDGYHGSSSHNTIFRNWFSGAYGSIILNRFKRNYVIAGNHLGADGVAVGGVSWGNPNMGNGNAVGFAGPTGLSDQVGEIDYKQPGYEFNEYVIQAGDVAVGDFWSDWEITGTLTTRLSDTSGIFTVSGGSWVVGDVESASGVLYPNIYWAGKSTYMPNGSVTNVAGNLVTITWGSGVLPAEGTAVQMYMGNAGWQERDLDVKASSTMVENYISASTGTGSVQDGTADTLPDSLAYTSKPAWFGNLDWPPFDPNNAATQDVTRIPAGYRYENGNEDYLGGVATPQFSPAPGTFPSAQTVTATCGTPDAELYYTIDGSDPDESDTPYTGPVTLPGTTTVFKVRAYKTGLDPSSVQSGTYTIGEAPAAPAAPTSFNAVPASSTQINLTWVDESDDETGFKVQQYSGSWTTIHTTAANVQSYSVTGLTPSTPYNFRVIATNGTGDSTPSNEDSATTNSVSGSYNFPGTPATNDTYTLAGRTWTFNGVGWRRTT